MSDMMKLTKMGTGNPIYINPETICTIEAYEENPQNGCQLYISERVRVFVNEDLEKVLNERRAAMERYP